MVPPAILPHTDTLDSSPKTTMTLSSAVETTTEPELTTTAPPKLANISSFYHTEEPLSILGTGIKDPFSSFLTQAKQFASFEGKKNLLMPWRSYQSLQIFLIVIILEKSCIYLSHAWDVYMACGPAEFDPSRVFLN
jgi:hypothetical protein